MVGVGDGELQFHGFRVSVRKDENILEMDGGYGHTPVQMNVHATVQLNSENGQNGSFYIIYIYILPQL